MPDLKEFESAVRAGFEERATELGMDPEDESMFEDDAGTGSDDAVTSGGESAAESPPGAPDGATTLTDSPQTPTSGAPATPVAQGPQSAPHKWPAEWKDKFGKLPPEAQAIALEVNNLMERGFSSKMSMLAKKGRELDSIERSVQPHMNRLHRAGITPELAVQRALAWDQHIQEHGPKGLMDMAQAYGFQPQQMQPQREEYLTPTERALKQQLEEMQGRLNGFEQNTQQMTEAQQAKELRDREDWAANSLQAFMTATDPDGKPKYPYLRHVQGIMARNINQGRARSLEEAYVLSMNEVQGLLKVMYPGIGAAPAGQAAPSLSESRKVEEVRRASNTGIVSKSPTPQRKQSFEDGLREAARKRA